MDVRNGSKSICAAGRNVKPTPNDHQTLEALKAFIADYSYPPTRRELADILNLKSSSTVQQRINRLIELGWVEVDDGNRVMRILK